MRTLVLNYIFGILFIVVSIAGGMAIIDAIDITVENELDKQCREAFYNRDELTLEMLCE